MSYEGSVYRLCERGHLNKEDALTAMHEPERMQPLCECKSKFVLCFDQDETNGYYEDEPCTHPPALNQIGFDDVPMEDHRGNKYVTMWRRYEPKPNSGQRWYNLLKEEE